jgi:cell filamentation protein
VSKYQFAESDIYLPGTGIPKNHLGIETPDLLHEVEATLLQQAYTRFITELEASVRFDETSKHCTATPTNPCTSGQACTARWT